PHFYWVSSSSPQGFAFMARRIGFIARWSQYFAIRMVGFLMAIGHVDEVLRLLGGIGRAGYRLVPKHRRRIMENLAHAMPELSQAARVQIAKGAFEHLIKLAGELVVTPSLLRTDTWSRYVRLGDLGRALEYLNTGKPAIVVTGHVGNWELLGFTKALLGYPVDAIARPIDNPLIDRWVKDVREQRGLRIIDKRGSNFQMTRVLKASGILGFVADQDSGRRGIFVPYFNRLASTSRSIATLATKRDVPVICGMCRRTGEGFQHEISVVDIIRPQDWHSQPDPVYYLTARYTRAIETMVRRCPEQYLWMHRRWKNRPVWEERGEPMPDDFRRKLESLPWMTGELMNQLQMPLVGDPDSPRGGTA
ncbi:MAG: hypothetical protein WD768_22665, partial [Phycisphaeraceae bacterium]